MSDDKREEIYKKILDTIMKNNGASAKDLAEVLKCTTANLYKYLNPMIEMGLIFKGIDKSPGKTKDDVETVIYNIEP